MKLNFPQRKLERKSNQIVLSLNVDKVSNTA